MPRMLFCRVLILNVRFAIVFVAIGAFFLSVGCLGAWDGEDTLENRIFIAALGTVGGVAALAAPVVWVGRHSVMWLLTPWRRVRFRDVSYFDGQQAQAFYAFLPDGGRRYVATHGGSFFERPESGQRRVAEVVQLLEDARVAAGGDPNPDRRRPSSPIVS